MVCWRVSRGVHLCFGYRPHVGGPCAGTARLHLSLEGQFWGVRDGMLLPSARDGLLRSTVENPFA
jgi:hypothetical protein